MRTLCPNFHRILATSAALGCVMAVAGCNPGNPSQPAAEASQTISFAAIPTQLPGGTLNLIATASSGLPVVFSSATTSVCTVAGSTVNLLSQGTCTINANQAGNDVYMPASTASQSFPVNLKSQTITFAALPNLTVGASFAVTASASSGLPVTLASTTPTICAFSGSTVSPLAVGTCSIEATQSGDNTYQPAPEVTQSLPVTAASAGSQSISFGAIPTQMVGTDLTLAASATSGLAVSYQSTTSNICTISGSTVSPIAVGACTIQAIQSGGGSFTAAPTVSQSFAVVAQSSTPLPRQQLLNLIKSESGKMTIAGQHNREATIGQPNWIQWIKDDTGDYPGLWGGDFLYEPAEITNRPSMINNLISGAKGGAVPDLMYTACPPTMSEGCWTWQGGVLSTLTDAQWADLVTPGGRLNQIWLSRLDAIAPYFQQIQTAGYPVFFRAIHEMNQSAFWWGGRPGPNGTSRLFQITHDYMISHWGLNNIVWVWDTQDIWNSTTNSYDFASYDPGQSYWDVMAFDFYDGNGFTTAKYDAVTAYAGSNPIAIGECQQLPTPAQLAAQPRWVYFMGWAELIQANDANSQVQDTYWAPDVTTEDGNNQMPGWIQ